MKYLIGIMLIGLLASCGDATGDEKAIDNEVKNELNGYSVTNFQIHKKFVEDFQKGWNNMDVDKLGHLNTVDTVIINYKF